MENSRTEHIMEAMEDKIKAVLEECERLCPKWGAANAHRLFGGGVAIWDARNDPQNARFGISVFGDERFITKEVLDSRPDLLEFYCTLLSLGVQSPAPDENGLLPCPHCNGKAIRRVYKYGLCTIGCDSCKISMRGSVDRDAAARLWNTRAHAPIQRQSLKDLNEAVLKTARAIVEDMERGREGPNVTVEKILSLVRDYGDFYAPSVGKDGNGLIDVPEPVGNFVFENAKGMMTSGGRYYHYSEVCSLLKRRDALKAQGDEFIAQRNHLQSLLRAERIKSSKLIEALESVLSWDTNNDEYGEKHQSMRDMVNEALAAYKGKEGGA